MSKSNTVSQHMYKKTIEDIRNHEKDMEKSTKSERKQKKIDERTEEVKQKEINRKRNIVR